MSPSEAFVVALAGGTGSGKSSIFNALIDVDAAVVGPLRPTTQTPLAAAAPHLKESVDLRLAAMGLDRPITQVAMPSVCLIDLPDTDSVVIDHRLRVDALIPRVDLVAWVMDPEKYRDAVLHHRYLRALASPAGRFVFVLNHIDRLDPPALDLVVADLRLALAEDGFTNPDLFLTAGDPSLGPPIGVEQLRDALERRARSTLSRFDLTVLSSATRG